MQESISLAKSRNLNESVWQSKRNRQQSEKEIELLLNRLQLLKREENIVNKKISETRTKTLQIVQMKLEHHDMVENKRHNQLEDDVQLKEIQKRNLQMKHEKHTERQLMREAILQIRKQEHDELKKVKKIHKLQSEIKKEEQLKLNKHKKDHIQSLLRQSRSNINLYWQEKLGRIQRENELAKLQNIEAQSKNELLLSQLEEEEMSMINKLQRSQEIREQLGKKLQRALDLPHDEFFRLYNEHPEEFAEENESKRKQKNFNKSENNLATSSRLGQSWITKKPENMLKTTGHHQPDKIDKSWLPKPEEPEEDMYQETQKTEQETETKTRRQSIRKTKKFESRPSQSNTNINDVAVGPDEPMHSQENIQNIEDQQEEQVKHENQQNEQDNQPQPNKENQEDNQQNHENQEKGEQGNEEKQEDNAEKQEANQKQEDEQQQDNGENQDQ